MLRTLIAPNPSPMTLDGTRTYLLGEELVAVIDPGPASGAHIDAIVEAIGKEHSAIILLTHKHPDHSGAAPHLASRLLAPIRSVADGTLADGDRFRTDAGELTVLHTPGHCPDHAAFHWHAGGAILCGDLMMGGTDTAVVAPPEGNLGDYLASLERLRSLEPRTLLPAHGPPIEDPPAAFDAYIEHRRHREQQVLDALTGGVGTVEAMVDVVYGASLDPALRDWAQGSLRAYLDHLTTLGRVRTTSQGWEAV